MRHALVLLLVGALCCPIARGGEITVSAAVSLKEAFTEITAAYEKQGGDRVKLNFGATGHLLAQIRDGAPVDGFASASASQMRQAVALGLVEPHAPIDLARNALVLIVPADAKPGVDGFPSLADARVKRLAIGQPKSVPAGEYATQVLDRLGLADRLRDRIVHGSSVRQVLDYVSRGEVDAGIVYATDARQAGERVKVVATAEPAWHEPIVYSFAPVVRSKQQGAARALAEFLTGETAQAILARHGFQRPQPVTTRPATTTRPAAGIPDAGKPAAVKLDVVKPDGVKLDADGPAEGAGGAGIGASCAPAPAPVPGAPAGAAGTASAASA